MAEHEVWWMSGASVVQRSVTKEPKSHVLQLLVSLYLLDT